MRKPIGASHAGQYLKLSDSLTIHYEESGNGDIPIIFIPGLTMSTKVFVRQLEHYADSSQFRAISYDPRGQGLTTKTTEGHYYEQHGRDLSAVIRELDLKDAVLVGWSAGSYDMLAYIRECGIDNVRGVVLLDGSPKAIGEDNALEWVWYRRDDADGLMKFHTLEPMRDRQTFNREAAKAVLENKSEENIQWFSDISDQTPDFVTALKYAAFNYYDFEPDLIALEGKVPLLYVVHEGWGEIVSAWAGKHTPSATVVEMGQHMMFWERHEEFNRVFDDYLKAMR